MTGYLAAKCFRSRYKCHQNFSKYLLNKLNEKGFFLINQNYDMKWIYKTEFSENLTSHLQSINNLNLHSLHNKEKSSFSIKTFGNWLIIFEFG